MEYEDSLCAFEGSDDEGNKAMAALRVVDGDGITIDEMAEQTKGSKVSCQIKKGDMTIFVALEGVDIYSSWLSSDDKSISSWPLWILPTACNPQSSPLTCTRFFAAFDCPTMANWRLYSALASMTGLKLLKLEN